ncbi:TIR domain-containing protein [Sphingomonas sp. RB56-2]|uniref:TIR domain-containing protein n=1 Tax=Sphingomonas brevis TaxID=2908206 RepID=A0ABT0S854_9SPHN|nr:toll/interleukin-1 receptor domain-containing protein [Sphingomonas brevis]MCL6740309.1 TIR domain-containing protein [Sphingomonas brevis]
MAKVFLSYDRDDTERARPVAAALEKAGHAVWWDLHVRGGAQFSKAIEEALESADAVVVLWSANSIESAWVRDEASVGRDTGRLVPVTIDGTLPPLGFRQFQTIDLPDRGGSQQMAAVHEAVESLADKGASPAVEPTPKRARPRVSPRLGRGPWLVSGILLLVIGLTILVLGLITSRPWQAKAAVPSVTVTASDPNAEPLARDLLVKLTTLQSAKSGSMQLSASGGKEADFIFQVSADSQTTPAASLMLLAGKNRTVLWSGDFRQGSGGFADLKQQASYTAARVLGCALDGFSSKTTSLKPAVFKSYLNACALLDETFFDDTSRASAMLLQVTKDAPEFRPGWAKLLIAETNRYQGLDERGKEQAAPEYRQLIASARRLYPNIPEADVAEIELLPGRDFYGEVKLIDRAAKADPDNVFVLAGRSLVMLLVGRMDAAVEDARHAASLDPLSPAIRSAYLQALIYSGRTDAARSELAEAERLWPDASTILDSRYRLDLRYGNAAEAAHALLLIQSGKVEGNRTQEAFLRARLEPTKANVDHAVAQALSTYRSRPGINETGEVIVTLGEFDRTAELIDVLLATRDERQFPYFVEMLFRPPQAQLRADPRFMQVAAHLGLLDYWQRSGDWPDFCADPDLPYDCKKEAAKLNA